MEPERLSGMFPMKRIVHPFDGYFFPRQGAAKIKNRDFKYKSIPNRFGKNIQFGLKDAYF